MTSTSEWVGGLVAMPSYVTGEGEPYRPELLIWMSGGAVVGMSIARPGELLARAPEHLREAIRAPMVSVASPSRLRVADESLAATLRTANLAPVVCAPTPEIDEAIASLTESLHGTEAPSYLGDATVDEVAAFFRASAAFFRAKPWECFPPDGATIVTCAELELSQAIVTVIGSLGESFGFLLFESARDFDMYLAAASQGPRARRYPAHVVLNFERGAELEPELRAEIARQRWEVASPQAYPWVAVIDEDLVSRPPTASELRRVEALALALARFSAESTGPITVETYAGPVTIELKSAAAPDDDTLLDEFARSPEASSLAEVGTTRLVLDYAADYLGKTPTSLGPADLREVLFEIFPRKVMMNPSEARDVVDELRAFFTFVKREHGFVHAKACLAVLGAAAAAKLESALGDASRFGMAKSIMMAGMARGFDVFTPEGVEAWNREIQGRPIPDSIRLPSLPSLPRADHARAAHARKKRKATRKARKKNR